VQTSTSLLRLKSTATTAGLANPILATTELVGSVTTSVLAIVLPLLALLLIAVVLYVIYRVSRRLLRRTGPAPVV
jgi:hypothetical protein